MSLLKQNIIRKEQVNKSLELELELDLNIKEDIVYKIEVINDSAIYTTEAEGQLPGLYYLIY